MIVMKKMILIGATEKHAGKTTFTTALIRKIKNDFPKIVLYAIKITILREEKHSVNGYKITEEKDMESGKDTARMLKAGTDKVLWLRCDEFNTQQGIEQLISQIPENAFIICESNSARKLFEPAIFIMIRKENEGEIKKTALSVLNFQHIEVRSSLNGEKVVYNPPVIEKISIESGMFVILK